MALPRALETYPQLVVLGNPGSGKSTLVRWLALVYARGSEGVRAALGWTEDRLPLVLPAAEFALAWQERPALSLEDYLRDRYGPARRLGELRPLIEEALERERIFLLIDGLDEVLSLEARRALIAQLHRLLRRYRGLQILVTSRIAGYGAAPLDAPFVSAHLRPLDKPAIELFLPRWSRALEEALRGRRDLSPAVEEQIERRAQEMSAAILEGHPGIRELARNPLMLTAMALIYEQGTRLPEQRIELYRLLVEAFVETWNRARSPTGRPIDLYLGGRRLDEPFAVRILGPLAFEMHRDQPGGWLPREALLDHIARLLQEREDVPVDRAGALADDFLRLIQEGTGLLVEREQGLFGFFHRTFEEYLAARHLADRFDPADPLSDLRPFLHHPAWQEVLLLLSGAALRPSGPPPPPPGPEG
ncbi:NACHT domain-containing NTPase [Thermoflexus sp.]|nr:NACHT domain-containing protein [Thermoflexus sp.]MCS6964029.1 NACHT domain-containing protein [Thermoflexus sp.]MCX7689435.1 NACHT domain-containing protein [Thermoflexus sp.]MDW8185571.1 NACHT domain-containing protein [Anaerolineae bacterium]